MKKRVPFDPEEHVFPCFVFRDKTQYTCVGMYKDRAILVREAEKHDDSFVAITHAWPIDTLYVEVDVPMVRRTFYVYKQGVSRYQVYDCYIEQDLLGGAASLCGSFNITIDPDTGKIVEVGLP
jgi:hypothetical protein